MRARGSLGRTEGQSIGGSLDLPLLKLKRAGYNGRRREESAILSSGAWDLGHAKTWSSANLRTHPSWTAFLSTYYLV